MIQNGAVAENRIRWTLFSQQNYLLTRSANVMGVPILPRLQVMAGACTKRHECWQESDRYLRPYIN